MDPLGQKGTEVKHYMVKCTLKLQIKSVFDGDGGVGTAWFHVDFHVRDRQPFTGHQLI